jgi:myo-inositol 2-dehydrogenase / D-chiro-inositol 1-dehydrogenase
MSEGESEREIRYGVIGTGMMGCEHLRNIAALPNAHTVAVADSVPTSLGWARTALAGAPAAVEYGDYRNLLQRDDLDAVVIVTPNNTHVTVLDDIFTNRPDLNILVEKPLCTTVSDCRATMQAARNHHGVVWVGLEYRYMPPVARFLTEIGNGAVGALRMLSIREHRHPFLVKVNDWNRFSRNTGGTLVEKCCHFFDLMNLAIEARPVRVLASGGQSVNHLDESYHGEVPDILDNAYVIVEYANAVRAMLDLSMFAEGGRNEQELTAVGDVGKVEAFIPSGTVVVGTRSSGRDVRVIDAGEDARIQHAGFHHGASYLEHLDFCAAIRNGSPSKVTLEDGLWSVAVGAAAHRSIEEQRPVLLSEWGLT